MIFAERALLPDGWAVNVRIDINASGTIDAVTAGAAAVGAYDVRGAIVPGMPNAHSHAFQRAMAGRAERRTHAHDDFWTWRETMYALANRLTPDDYYKIARTTYRTMLLAGYTSVAEFHYVHRDPAGHWYADRAAMARAAIAAARDAGIAICLLPALYAHGEVGGSPLDECRKRFATSVDDVLAIATTLRSDYASDPDVAIGICAHSLRAVTPAELHELVSCSPSDVPVHIHIAEQIREVEAVEAQLGARPVAWLLAHADVGERWCLVHATHLDQSERKALAHSGATVALCPTTEANLGDGIFPLGPYLDDAGAIGIGSDSNVSIGVSEELRLLEYGQRLAWRRRHVAARSVGTSCGEELYRAASFGGARAVGRKTGALAPGYRADLVVLAQTDSDSQVASDSTPDDTLDRYVFASDPARPSAAMVSGRWSVNVFVK